MDRPGIGLLACTILLAAMWTKAAPAQDAAEKEIEKYRAMISDPMSNPGFLAVDRGEALWQQKRGAKNASLEGCDLGLGAEQGSRTHTQPPSLKRHLPAGSAWQSFCKKQLTNLRPSIQTMPEQG